MLRVALMLALVSLATGVAGQQPIPFDDPSQPIALVIRYAGGRIVRSNLGQSYRSWTPTFPRVPGWSDPDGLLPVEAIQYVGTRTSDGFRIAVSVLRGKQHQQQTSIATVLLTDATPVSITVLQEVGVAPVEMWVEPGDRLRLYAPAVENRTAGLDVTSIEAVEGPPAGLIITVRNVSTRTALSYNFETFSGGRPSLSGRQAIAEAKPVIAPRGDHTFRLNVYSSLPVPKVDLLVITGVQWTDGTFEGDARAAAWQWCRDAAGRAQVGRILSALRQVATADPAALGALQTRVDALETVASDPMVADVAARLTEPRPVSTTEIREAIASMMQVVKKGLLDEIADARSRELEAGANRQWIESTTARYAEWLSRLSAR